MPYFYNDFGWYTAAGAANRQTDIAPPTLSETEVENASRANWSGSAWAAMPYKAPADHVAWQADQDAAAVAKTAQKDNADVVRAAITTDPATMAFLAMTPTQIDDFVDANITDIADIKLHLKTIVKTLVSYTARLDALEAER